MAKKKGTAGEPSNERTPTTSALRPGGGSKRIKSRNILIYGPPKSRKTTAAASLPIGRTKWLISDPNCVATLRALGRLPADEDLYEVDSLKAANELVEEMLTIAREQGADALGIDWLVNDSLTQYSDWHQKVVAAETGQRFMGDAGDGSGWQQFNAEFGDFLDNLALLTQLGVSVVSIAHSKDKLPKKKGEWACLNLPPQMSAKAARLSNWILFKTFEEKVQEGDDPPSGPFISAETGEDGKTAYFESVLWTKPLDGWNAAVNSLKLNHAEAGDLATLLKKDGLLEDSW